MINTGYTHLPWSTNTLSNFHISPFELDSHIYQSAEHYIQHKKACHFGDYSTAVKILQSKTPTDSKTLSRNIKDYTSESWRAVVREACKPGIRVKFMQNPTLLEFLKSHKTIKNCRKQP